MTKRSALALLAAALLVLEPLAAAGDTRVVRLREGIPIYMRPAHELRSDRSHTGDTVTFIVRDPVRVRGVTLIARGAHATGVVTRARHASGLGRDGILDLAIDSVPAVDGTPIRLRANAESRGGSQGSNTALSVGLIVFVSVFGVFLQGREAVIPADREFTVYVDEERDFAVAGPAAGGILGRPRALPRPAMRAPAGSAESYPPGTNPGDVLELRLCREVARGEPQRAGERFPAAIPRLTAWFRMAPPRQDSVYDVHWYRGDRLVAASSLQIRAGEDRAWAALERSEAGGFPAGLWKVFILKGDRVQSQGTFTIGP